MSETDARNQELETRKRELEEAFWSYQQKIIDHKNYEKDEKPRIIYTGKTLRGKDDTLPSESDLLANRIGSQNADATQKK